MNTEFVFGRANKKIYCSLVQMKGKQRHTHASAHADAHICVQQEKKSFQNARNHSQHKRYELQNKFKNRIKKVAAAAAARIKMESR